MSISAPVCVVIPCFNCGKTIKRAIDSVIGQTWRPESLIIVDDASNEETAEVLKNLWTVYDKSWLRLISLPSNRGPAYARNAGWNSADQEYVAFLDADDAWHPQKIEMQCKWMRDHPEVSLTGHRTVWLKRRETSCAVVDKVTAERLSKWRLLLSNRFSMRSVMVRRDVSIRFDSDMRHMEDYMFLLRMVFSEKQIATLYGPLAFIYKADYGASGLSSQLWKMEKGELRTYWRLRKAGSIGDFLAITLMSYSLMKYLKRLSVVGVRRLYGG